MVICNMYNIILFAVLSTLMLLGFLTNNYYQGGGGGHFRTQKLFLANLDLFKLRLGALIPRSVCLSVCLSVGLSVLQKLQKITKLYKTSENHLKR